MMRVLPFEYAVRNLGRSRTRLLAGLAGSALVATLVIAAAAYVRGMDESLSLTAGPQNVVVLGAGSEESIERSEIAASVADILDASLPGIRRSLGAAYVSPEVHMQMGVRLRRDDSAARTALVRGITPAAFLVHERLRIVDGRAPRPGHDEILVGDLAATRLEVDDSALAVGRTLWWDDRPWTITGRFTAPGTIMNAEIWCPLSDFQIASRRKSLSCVVMTLDDAEFADVDAFCKQRLDLELVALRESDYYARLVDFFGPIRAMIWATAALIAFGGLLGGLNTLYAAFAARIREFAALQTLGYSRTAIVVSLVQESLLMTAAGALFAAALGLAALDGLGVRFSMGAFALRVDAHALMAALLAGLLLGIIGALPPAWRCLRLPIMEALRAA